jgi:hypothetical protein
MSKLSTYWTGAVAYLSLLVGAGLSVAGNLADTYRIRGGLVDAVDIVLAIGPPLATLLVAELFVSQWPRAWSLQAVRWGGTITVGTLAMVVSWLHLSELLAARGQTALVAILWPLAIDGLAIMAMAKLLAMRGHGQAVATTLANGDVLSGPVDSVATVATEMDKPRSALRDVASMASGHEVTAADMTPFVATPTDWDAELAKWDTAIDVAGQDVATAAEAITRPVATVTGVPAEARDLLTAWDPQALSGPEVDALLAEHFGKTARTARRWRSIVRPTSA